MFGKHRPTGKQIISNFLGGVSFFLILFDKILAELNRRRCLVFFGSLSNFVVFLLIDIEVEGIFEGNMLFFIAFDAPELLQITWNHEKYLLKKHRNRDKFSKSVYIHLQEIFPSSENNSFIYFRKIN